ncbi:MBL fold metallo-hydrolase [Shewanella profunda]|uniref:MBL fold metallo-hydrolase n=1 Tax=Shewanella profunda TaxID=254793 RepID=UPI00200F50F1|nr:MBL fold metallo-hydrolase [Shewanella profunda]MCL1089824.1 MBL fold metallo-hydrolase [Shewanella profunda]
MAMHIDTENTQTSAHVKGDRFSNNAPNTRSGDGNLLAILWRYITERIPDKTPSRALPVHKMQLNTAVDMAPMLYKISHSTLLLQLNGQYWLTDPVFSKRASPSQLFGPKRFHQLPIELKSIPALAGIILSHDHYDHLEKHSILVLAERTQKFIVPLGVDKHLLEWGIPANKIVALNWWQETQHAGVHLTATPAQHFSGRGLTDKNQTLWASWVIQIPTLKLFFSGDSGYFDGFKKIGDKFGPFDLTLIETGAYDEMWADIHMQPEQSLRAHLDLRGQHLIPIHNSSFDLALHSWYEPLERIATAAKAYDVPLLTPIFGQGINLSELANSCALNHSWWKAYLPENRPQFEIIPARISSDKY